MDRMYLEQLLRDSNGQYLLYCMTFVMGDFSFWRMCWPRLPCCQSQCGLCVAEADENSHPPFQLLSSR